MAEIKIRFATSDDVGLLLQLIRELAAYERAPDAVVATEDDLRRIPSRERIIEADRLDVAGAVEGSGHAMLAPRRLVPPRSRPYCRHGSPHFHDQATCSEEEGRPTRVSGGSDQNLAVFQVSVVRIEDHPCGCSDDPW